ncbi:minor capsid protein [Hungatella hathewayi]|uniref:minor capsid protein n=1 Tax=Hungatella hathewayi TaxID=154046 RepID=UPI00210D3546|nr:minor capsid protein [Hungatella hathewayi]MCQ5384283.1 minor capsid protein [Hungatella hathewayi]
MGYWQKRQEAMYKAGEMQVNQYYAKLEKAFNQTRRELQKTIEAFYFEYAEENGLSYAVAQRQLSKAEIGNLRDFIDLTMENIGKHNQTVNNMSIKARITRYQALEAQVDAMLRQLYAVDYQAAAEQTMKEVYKDTYYRTWYNIDQYRGFHAAFAQVDPHAVEKLLEYPFNGASFSSRLWKQKDHLQTQLMESLTTMMVQGKSPQSLTNDFAKKMNSKKFDAYRLLHTESSFLMSEATHAGYKEDGVEKYQILATLDSKTCEICGDKDGEVYEVGKEITGENMPPFHCFCRCTDVPFYDDDDLSGKTRVARDPETGKTVEVPADMTYKEWSQKYAGKGDTLEDSLPDKAKKMAKGIVSGETVINYDELPAETRESFESGLLMSDSRVSKLLQKESKDTQYYVTDSRNSEYMEHINLIGVNPMGGRGTIAHEVFHRIDDKYKVTKGSNMLTNFEADIKKNKELFDNPILYLTKRYPDAFEKSITGRDRLKEEYRGISDIFSALSDGSIHLGFGHEEAYWTKKPDRRMKEIWAQYGRMYYENNPKAIKMLNDLFPSGTERVNMKLKGLMKNVEG